MMTGSNEQEYSSNLFISAAKHPTLHEDLEKIREKIEAGVANGGSKTTRVRLALHIASRMSERDLLKSMLALTERDFLGCAE